MFRQPQTYLLRQGADILKLFIFSHFFKHAGDFNSIMSNTCLTWRRCVIVVAYTIKRPLGRKHFCPALINDRWRQSKQAKFCDWLEPKVLKPNPSMRVLPVQFGPENLARRKKSSSFAMETTLFSQLLTGENMTYSRAGHCEKVILGKVLRLEHLVQFKPEEFEHDRNRPNIHISLSLSSRRDPLVLENLIAFLLDHKYGPYIYLWRKFALQTWVWEQA